MHSELGKVTLGTLWLCAGKYRIWPPATPLLVNLPKVPLNAHSGKEFGRVVEGLVDREVAGCSRKLGGYEMRRGGKAPIVFAKEEIIKEHIRFLASTPTPVFEIEP
jgi:hypothetical protein